LFQLKRVEAMQLRPLAGGVAILASLPLLGIMASPPSPSHANVSISVSAAESCSWYLENVPEEISLESETKYRGEAISVSATLSAAIGFSGDATTPDFITQCSFFNSSLTAKKLTVTLVGSEFIARYNGTRDDSMSFGIDERPLNLGVASNAQNCPQVEGLPAAVSQTFNWGPTKNLDDLVRSFDLVTYSSTPDVGEKNHFPSGEAAKCAPRLELSVEIRPNQPGPPDGAGLTYVFTGPSLTFALENN
jgi:hypothetical protein